MEMSEKIHPNLLKIMIFFQKMAKNDIFDQKNFGLSTKRNFKIKILKLHENHLKTNVYEWFHHFIY